MSPVRPLRVLLPVLPLALPWPALAAEDYSGAGIGLQAGAVLPSDEMFEIAPFAGVEVSVVLPYGGGRLRPLASLSGSWLATEGPDADPRIGEGSYTWTLDETFAMFGVGLMARPFPPSWSFQIDARVVPQVAWITTESGGVSIHDEFGITTQRYLAPGALASLGFALDTRWGEFTVAGGWMAMLLRGSLSGTSTMTGIVPTAGYRYWF